MLPSGSFAAAERCTVNGAVPLSTSAVTLTEGRCPTTVFDKNHGVAVGSVLKNAISSFAIVRAPRGVGWKPPASITVVPHVRPSERGRSPSAQRYGPQERYGDTTGPASGS